jgi:hypothetical protein
MSPPRILALSIGLAASMLACGSDDDDERHGIVKLELQPAQPVSDTFPDPFAGTVQIVATVQYGDCLTAYYADDADRRFDGEIGSALVEEWIDRLCDEAIDLEMPIDCTVARIDQHLDGGPAQLEVGYAVTGDLAGRQLAVGPLPNETEARCPGGALPEVHVGAVRGLDGAGVLLWQGQSVSQTDAVVDQGAAVTIYAARVPAP